MTDAVEERTLVLIKPDGLERGLVGRILARFEDRGLRIAGLRLVHADRALAERHYAAHAGKGFYEGLVAFITSGPLVAVVLEGPGAISMARTMIGATDPRKADPGTIRGDLAVDTGQNLVHASDSPESVATELALWFGAGEVVEYRRDLDRWISGSGGG